MNFSNIFPALCTPFQTYLVKFIDIFTRMSSFVEPRFLRALALLSEIR